METKGWKDIKDTVYGEKGTGRRDNLERGFESFKIGLLLKKAREQKELIQTFEQSIYISHFENSLSGIIFIGLMFNILFLREIITFVLCFYVNTIFYTKLSFF